MAMDNIHPFFKGFVTRRPTDEEPEPIPEKRARTEVDYGLNTEQQQAFDAIIAGKSIFITGPGGTGKSYLIQTLYEHYKLLTGKIIAVTAMTGCAGLLIGPWAKTLHSWGGIGLGRLPAEQVAAGIAKDSRKKKRWTKTDCLVIDEVSMLTPSLLEYLDKVGRLVRKKDLPFGGLQVVFVGDFYQLPPVSKESTDKRIFAFESLLWSQVVQTSVKLTQILRQKDPVFQGILNEARVGELSPNSYAILETRKTMDWKRQEIKPTLLFVKNHDVSSINQSKLDKLPGKEHIFEAETTGAPEDIRSDILQMLVEKIDKDASYEPRLALKVGAQVMLLKQLMEEKDKDKDEDKDDEKNKKKKVKSPIHGLVNGSRGIVTGFDKDGYPRVKFVNGKEVTVQKEKWSSDSEKDGDGVTREQVPLRLAYALTIHKAQGASLDSALIDVGPSTFEYGQAYVALSRVRSMESLYIFEISPRAFRAHPAVKAFYATL
jgi:ATP-dependent DNA helicase PIF1